MPLTDSFVSTALAVTIATAHPNVAWSLLSAALTVSGTSVSQPHQQIVTGLIDRTTVLWDTFTP